MIEPGKVGLQVHPRKQTPSKQKIRVARHGVIEEVRGLGQLFLSVNYIRCIGVKSLCAQEKVIRL